MIIENPYSEMHYLRKYWPIKPKIVDVNRRDRGDYYKKPTQYWFVNCEPKNNLIPEGVVLKPKRIVEFEKRKTLRSMIHPDYANRFIREFVIDDASLAKEENKK